MGFVLTGKKTVAGAKAIRPGLFFWSHWERRSRSRRGGGSGKGEGFHPARPVPIKTRCRTLEASLAIPWSSGSVAFSEKAGGWFEVFPGSEWGRGGPGERPVRLPVVYGKLGCLGWIGLHLGPRAEQQEKGALTGALLALSRDDQAAILRARKKPPAMRARPTMITSTRPVTQLPPSL